MGPIAGRLKALLENWKILTRDPWTLQTIEGYQIPFLSTPIQNQVPLQLVSKEEEMCLVDHEVQEMLSKGAIELLELCQGQFLSSLFLVEKKEAGCFRPVINLKSLNQYIPYEHFKMESLSLLKDILQPGDFMCKVDLKVPYFAVPLSKNSSKHVRFLWREKLYQFICLCFGLGPAPKVFTKLLKVPITLLRRLNIRLIIFLDDILLMQPIQRAAFDEQGYSYILTSALRFHNKCQEVSVPTVSKNRVLGHDDRFCGDDIESSKRENRKNQSQMSKDALEQTSNNKGTSPIDRAVNILSIGGIASPVAIPSNAETTDFRVGSSIKGIRVRSVALSRSKGRVELVDPKFRVEQRKEPCETAPTTNYLVRCFHSGLGAACQGLSTGGKWSQQERESHINILELKAAKFAVMIYTQKFPHLKYEPIRIDNMTALSYLVKMGGTRNKTC